ncbi:MAG: WecB/TagA/CpsF family glycosyltransferase [Bacteroidetes bacterium]|nr:WecB/TagA/CpsF family glycosyltransferase [Bacteroidota bacterium]
MLQKQHIFNLDFVAAENFDAIIQSLVNEKDEQHFPAVITPNVDLTVHLNKNKQLLSVFQNSRFILPDGAPIIWFSKLLGKPLKKRLAGSDLFPLIWKASIQHNKKLVLILPNEEVKAKLEQEYPSVQSYIPPFFEAEKNAVEQQAQNIFPIIQTHQPDFVFLGLRYPKQEMLIINLYEKLKNSNTPIPVFYNLGASYEFYTGMKSRAPKWIQKIGLEWLHRFLSEPKRTFKRYFYDDLYIFVLFLKEFFNKKHS